MARLSASRQDSESLAEKTIDRAASVLSLVVNQIAAKVVGLRGLFQTKQLPLIVSRVLFHLPGFLNITGAENSSIHRPETKKERRMAESQAPPSQLNQFLPYLNGSPPSRQERRCAHYKFISPNCLWTISAAAMNRLPYEPASNRAKKITRLAPSVNLTIAAWFATQLFGRANRSQDTPNLQFARS
jgi:hypothetical protein